MTATDTLIHITPFLSQYHSRYTINCKWDHNLVAYDGLLPLIKIYQAIGTKFNDPFLLSKHGHSSSYRTSIDPQGGGNKTSKHSYRRRNSINRLNIYTGFYSAIGYKELEFENEKVSVNQQSNWFVKSNQYDIFILGVLKKPYRYRFDTSSMQTQMLTVREKDIVLLLNAEKFHKNAKFITSNYSITIRKYLKYFVERMQLNGLMEIRVVSDDYLNNFIKQGVDLNTNSIIDLMETQKKVVDNVFSTLKPESIIV